MNFRHVALMVVLGAVFLLPSVGRSQSGEVTFETDLDRVYVHEAKKVDLRVKIEGASTEEGGPRWNLVEVDESGAYRRYVGVLFYSRRKGAFFRKLEMQEKTPGPRYFEVVPDAELEPFVQKPRPRLMIDVAPRPTLIEILQGIWRKLTG